MIAFQSDGRKAEASKTPSGVKRAPFERRDKTGLLLVCHSWGGGAQQGAGEVESGGVGMDKTSWERGRGREREGRNVFFFYCFLCNLTKSKRARGTEGEERGELLQSECVTPAGPWEDPVNTAQSQL